MNRHDRQTRLTEVGAAGQARLAQGTADVPLDGFAGELAVRYLAGAGVGRLRVRSTALAEVVRAVDPATAVEVEPASRPADTVEAPDGVEMHDPTAREAARGALVALGILRRLLAGTGGPS